MKVSHAENNVLGSGGLGPTQSFQIRTNAHAFKMLSSGLYSDKIKAVLREIGCNAHDAHIATGQTHTSFEVKLPNGIDPQFWIRDFGPGLSHEDVMGLYTTYFSSTKQESDEFTGGFGLGSKSPFSYTDSFMVVSYHAGMEMTYTCHIGNDGSPKIAKMGEAPTTESGIKVSFSVPSHDFGSFQSKAQEVYQYFNPLPRILGGDDIRPAEYEKDMGKYAISGTGYLALQMGNVVYPIKFDQISKGYDDLVDAFRNSRGFLFRMPIGTVAVAASREELQYDPAAVTAIRTEMMGAAKDVCLELEKAYKAVADWKSRCNFASLYKKLNQGVSVNERVFVAAGLNQIDANRISAACHDYSIAIDTTNFHKDVTVATYTPSRFTGRVNKEMPSDYSKALFIPLSPEAIIVAGTVPQAHQRIRKALCDGTMKYIIAVYPSIGKIVSMADLDKIVAEITKTTGKIDIIDLATLDRPVVQKSARAKIPKGTFPDGEVYTRIDDKPVSSTTITNKIYVKVQMNRRWGRFDPVYLFDKSEYNNYAWEILTDEIAIISKFAGLVKPVFVTYAQMKAMRLEKNPAWKTYGQYLTEQLLDKKAIAGLKAKIKSYIPKVDFTSSKDTPLECLVRIKKSLPAIYDKITPALRKSSVLKEIEKVYAVSMNPKILGDIEVPELIRAYRSVAGRLTTDLADIPDLDKSESIVNTKIGDRFRKLNSTFIANVAALSEKACVTILTEALTQ